MKVHQALWFFPCCILLIMVSPAIGVAGYVIAAGAALALILGLLVAGLSLFAEKPTVKSQ